MRELSVVRYLARRPLRKALEAVAVALPPPALLAALPAAAALAAEVALGRAQVAVLDEVLPARGLPARGLVLRAARRRAAGWLVGLVRLGLPRGGRPYLGFGRIVVSEAEAPSLPVKPVERE